MKKSWKKLLCSLMLAPCMFVATACGDDPEDPSNLTTDLTIEQQQEAYTTLRTVAAAALNNDGSKDQSYTMQSNYSYKQTINIDNAGLSEDNKEYVESNVNLQTSNGIVKTLYGGYKANNTGYISEVVKFVDESGLTQGTATNFEIVKYNGQYYELYSKDKEDIKELSKVNNVYAKNVIPLSDDMLLNNMNYEKIGGVLEQTSNDTFDQFKDSLFNLSGKAIAENSVSNVEDKDFLQYINSAYAFTVTDGVYSLTLDVVLDANGSDLDYLEEGVLSGVGKVCLSFDAHGIKKLDVNYTANMTSKKNPAAVLAEYVTQSYTADDFVTVVKTNEVKLSLDFTASFDESFYGQELTGYVGSGPNGEVQNTKVNTNLYVINSTLDESIIVDYLIYNDNLLDSLKEKIAPVLNDYGLFIQSCYIIDADGNKVDVDESTLVPSTEFSVYVELTDEVREFVETNVTIFVVNDSSENLCSFYIDDNLYNEVKAVMGLTDEQIAGIYSDAELENLLDSSTLITENMTVYLVLNSSVSSDN